LSFPGKGSNRGANLFRYTKNSAVSVSVNSFGGKIRRTFQVYAADFGRLLGISAPPILPQAGFPIDSQGGGR
jgi:hypothetical protein